ncbi:MAG: SH3 domain-containing protein [Anaerolineae bacterium]
MTATAGGSRRQREEESGLLEGSWVWIALPVGILVLIAALWFLVIAPAGSAPPRATALPGTTATLWPTLTPISVIVPTTAQGQAAPAPDATLAPVAQPGAIQIGSRVVVVGTGERQLRVRQQPGLDTVTIKVVPDGTILVVVDGPVEASELTWWKIDTQSGTTGWVAGKYLKLAQ